MDGNSTIRTFRCKLLSPTWTFILHLLFPRSAEVALPLIPVQRRWNTWPRYAVNSRCFNLSRKWFDAQGMQDSKVTRLEHCFRYSYRANELLGHDRKKRITKEFLLQRLVRLLCAVCTAEFRFQRSQTTCCIQLLIRGIFLHPPQHSLDFQQMMTNIQKMLQGTIFTKRAQENIHAHTTHAFKGSHALVPFSQ